MDRGGKKKEKKVKKGHCCRFSRLLPVKHLPTWASSLFFFNPLLLSSFRIFVMEIGFLWEGAGQG